jgi:hypothetical protein
MRAIPIVQAMSSPISSKIRDILYIADSEVDGTDLFVLANQGRRLNANMPTTAKDQAVWSLGKEPSAA